MPRGTGMDGSDGNQPRGTQVRGNLCHEYGFNQKQSSCVFMAKSMETNITGSKIVIFLDLRAVRLANPKIITISDIMFNAARAHINQNVSAAITYCFCSCCLMLLPTGWVWWRDERRGQSDLLLLPREQRSVSLCAAAPADGLELTPSFASVLNVRSGPFSEPRIRLVAGLSLPTESQRSPAASAPAVASHLHCAQIRGIDSPSLGRRRRMVF